MGAKINQLHFNFESIVLQWNPALTIYQGDVKIISLNRDIVIPGFTV